MDNRDTLGLSMALPPPPLPTKDRTSKEPSGTSSASPPDTMPPTSTTPPPPNRPLPPTPRPKKGTAHSQSGSISSTFSSPRSPPPTRPPPLKSQASLYTISPTRPETASSLGKKAGHSRLHTQSSWTSLASTTRTIKYGRGKHSGVELVPQPSDDPEDPLVSSYAFLPLTMQVHKLTFSELAPLAEGVQLLCSAADGSFNWSYEDSLHQCKCSGS